MKALGKWSVNHEVSVNLMMLFVLIAGGFTAYSMKREVFPQFSLDMIDIGVRYPGASPEETEEAVCIKIEEQLKSVEGVKNMYSTAIESYGDVFLELAPGIDINEKLDEIKNKIDQIDSFPEEVKDPVITEIKSNDPAIWLAVYGDVNEKVLRDTADKIRDDLVEEEEISLADLTGVREYEISIELSEESLRQYGLSFDMVAAAVKTGTVDLPGGKIKTRGGEFLVRSKGKRYTGDEFARIPVITREDGTIIRLGDIARIRDGFEDRDLKARFNGKPAAMIIVRRTENQDNIKISNAVKAYIEKHREEMPRGVSLGYWLNVADLVQDRIDLLLKNGAQGIVLVFIVLALFLNLKLAFWVSTGIPISFMGAFLVLSYFDASLNMLSMFAFIMTLGILVDDAIIIGENVYTHSEMGKPSKQAVIEGVAQVGGPVVMAVATTMVAFAPIMNIAGVIGKFIAIMPQAVICILAFSLVEAFIILPAHLHSALKPSIKANSLFYKVLFFWLEWLKKDLGDAHDWLRKKTENALMFVIYKIYTPLLRYCVKNRYFALAAGVGVLIVSIGVLAGGHVPFLLFGKTDSNWMISEIIYPLGTPFDVTEKTVKQIENGAFKLNDYFRDRVMNGEDLILNTFSQVGIIPHRDWKPGVHGGHCGEAWIEIQPSDMRPGIPAPEVIAKWREFAGDVLGLEQLTFSNVQGGPAGNPIEIQLAGDDLGQLQRAADDLKGEIAKYPGTYDITDNFRPGKMEIQLRVREGAKPLGITMADIATQIRQAYFGDEALTIQRGRHDIKVMVRYSKAERESEASIDELRIRTADGRQIPLNQVADLEIQRGYSNIQRVNRKRTITVISDINENVANAQDIIKDLRGDYLEDLLARYPGVTYDLEGQAKRSQEMMESLGKGFGIAAMIMFMLLASQFRSYFQPVIIMAAIPFGLVGSVAGHYLMGLPLTMFSIFGIVALSGIVVNDSLILIDFINAKARKKTKLLDAVIESGQNRFRPVLLTSITTIAGLLPLLLETSFQAQFLIPMAVSISFGLMAATILTLLFVPAIYVTLEDVTGLFIAKKRVKNERRNGKKELVHLHKNIFDQRHSPDDYVHDK